MTWRNLSRASYEPVVSNVVYFQDTPIAHWPGRRQGIASAQFICPS
jgi:hypothetical protein